MGWLVGWHSRAALVEHLRQDYRGKILAERSTQYGRHLWWACEGSGGERFVILFLICGSARSEEPSWGYKDIEETMGPVELDCPLDLFDLVPEPTGDDQSAKWAREWRERVRAFHARGAEVFAPGDRVQVSGSEYTVVGPYKRSYLVERNGRRFRASPRTMQRVAST
jgi:hypothetical protein